MPRARGHRRPALWGAVLAMGLGVSACTDPGSDAEPSTSARISAPSTTPSPSTTSSPPSSTTSSSPTTAPTTSTVSATLARNLDVPWAVAFLPDGTALVTLRDRAELLHVRPGQAPRVLGTIPGVDPDGEGGLLGVAVSPTFASDHRVFVYFTAARDNRVARLTFTGGSASEAKPILTGIPKAGNHNGGRLAFGPDGFLYATTGDASRSDRAQDKGSLGGKILRITQDGKPAPGNPFGDSPVWSLGHRNVQGIAWAPDGTMYASEFGQNTWDELNRIVPGHNYGWPKVEGRAGRRGFDDPLAQWATADASPSGIAVADGAVWMTALRGESMWRIPLSGNRIGKPQRLLHGEFGRLRDVVHAPDGRLWFLTSNTFRGTPAKGDDRLVARPPDAFA